MERAYVCSSLVPKGSGKTLSMIYDIRKELLRAKDKIKYHIVSNTDFILNESVLIYLNLETKELFIDQKS